MSDSKSTEEKSWAESFIENWIPIEIKDPLYVKEAKITARKEFLQLFDQELKTTIERVLDKVEAQCEYCDGNGFIYTFASGSKDELPEREICDGEIHVAIHSALNNQTKEDKTS